MTCDRKVGPFDCCSVIHGDSREILPQIPEGRIDFTLTDPPYGVGLDYDSYNDSRENLKRLMEIILPELHRISALTILTPGVLNLDLYERPDWVAAWICPAGTGRSKNNWGFSCWQPIILYGTPERKVSQDIINWMEPADSTGSFHPCAKPMKFWKQLMLWGVPESKHRITRVLDPFGGSGTTAFAAIELGIHYLVVEQSKKYVDEIRLRLDKARTCLFTT